MSDLKTMYPNSMINSDVDFKSTLVGRELKDVFLNEYMPLGRRKVEGIKHFNLSDIPSSEMF